MTINANEFQDFVAKHTWDAKDVFFTASALAGELGEVTNVLKKEEAYKDFPNYTIYVDQEIEAGRRTPFRDQFVDEAGDTLFYYMQMLNKKGVTIEEVMMMQMAKLRNQTLESGETYKK